MLIIDILIIAAFYLIVFGIYKATRIIVIEPLRMPYRAFLFTFEFGLMKFGVIHETLLLTAIICTIIASAVYFVE